MSAQLPAGRRLTPVDALAQLSFLIQGALERRAGEERLSLVQTRLLGVLRDRQPTMNALAGYLQLEKSSVTGLVDRAQRRGLVRRTPSPDDGRVVLVALTDAGRSLVSAVSGRFAADLDALLGALTAGERDAVTGLATRLVAAAAAEQGIDLFDGAAPDRDRRDVAGGHARR